MRQPSQWAPRGTGTPDRTATVMPEASHSRMSLSSTFGAAASERRFGNRMSMCPYKRPYNSGTIRIRLLPSPSVMAALTCGKRPVGYCPVPSFPASFRFPKPCAKVRILPGAPIKAQGGERGHDSEAAPNRHARRPRSKAARREKGRHGDRRHHPRNGEGAERGAGVARDRGSRPECSRFAKLPPSATSPQLTRWHFRLRLYA